MTDRDNLVHRLASVLSSIKDIDPADPQAAATLSQRFPPDGPELTELAALVRRGVEQGWWANRGELPVLWSRVAKPEHPGTHGLSIDVVSMTAPGPGHAHPNGEIDLCFAVSGEPRFDGHAPGWVVYPPGSWHVPTVSGGQMDILYFLPGGAIQFGPRPGAAATE
jgi:hypothetical protein